MPNSTILQPLPHRQTSEVMPSRKAKSVIKCIPCRSGKKKCLPEHRDWPLKCERCTTHGITCSKGTIKPRINRYVQTHNNAPPQPSNSLPPLAAKSSTFAYLNPKPFILTQQCTPEGSDPSNQEAIFLLGISEVVNMALDELQDLATDMAKPFQRHPHISSLERCMPGIDAILDDFKCFSLALQLRMLEIGAAKLLLHAQLALTSDYFRRKVTWISDMRSLEEVRRSVKFYHKSGHAGFAYVLQMKLMLEETHWRDEDIEDLKSYRQPFLQDVRRFLLNGSIPLPTTFAKSQVFVPRRFLQIPAIATGLRKDGRPDCLGRSVYNILYDAGIPVKWSKEEVDRADVLGRTALHMACRKCDEHSIRQLLELLARVDQRALNGLLPLHFSAIFGTKTTCAQIWSRQHFVGAATQDGYGRSPLLWAAFSGSSEVVAFFHGRTFAVQDDYGCTAVGIAAAQGHMKIVTYLAKQGYACDVPDVQGRTPFYPLAVAAKHGSTKAVAYLLGLPSLHMYQNQFQSDDDLDLSPMVLAAAEGEAECVKLILQLTFWNPTHPVIERVREIANRHNNNAILGLLPQHHDNTILSRLPQHLLQHNA
ncbi:ankyrin [Dothidotthia symphoricarpi CBS 119687]|uniref:Ankyrin n=1 Tax=Dothidotthia symphoricarpi CBS 119687 TaxID=1392245 RepID=A0A6A6A7E7_9PLEO|nr:ankyrin [Dothidotthia symphoricarpi CBS 119687]KAF2127506.1 ankyrin [Dothidotthia symphoricarpi CBS 119687]